HVSYLLPPTAPSRVSTLSLHDALPLSWSFHDFLDSDGGTEARPYRVDLTLTRTGDHVTLDGTRSDDQARGPINYMTNPGLLRIADRKSTRLNSSHVAITHAVFFLNKKN